VGTEVLRQFAKSRKASISFVAFVRPSARNDTAPAGRVFIKFDEYFSKYLLRKFKFH